MATTNGPRCAGSSTVTSSLGVDVTSLSRHQVYILYGVSRMMYAEWCQNDFNVQGYSSPAMSEGL
jgi:hypothetical protein